MFDPFVFREITSDDINGLADMVIDAFDAYRVFAPPNWQPPPVSDEAHLLRRWIADPGFWGELATDEQALVGHATFIPAERHPFRPDPDTCLAHLGHLFVQPQYWGSGVATQLLAHATIAAAAQGFAAMRLFVHVGQARARRFYTREGFAAVGEPFKFVLGLPVLQYQNFLEPVARATSSETTSTAP